MQNVGLLYLKTVFEANCVDCLGPTYLCESVFSEMKIIKLKYRSRLDVIVLAIVNQQLPAVLRNAMAG